MANVPESAVFDTGIYQIELVDAVIGGVNGISNLQAKGLANRTTWLKQQVDALNLLKGTGVPVFSAANNYTGGQQVIYQKNIWQANTAITAGSFNPANWTRQLGVGAECALADAAPLMNGTAAVGTSTDLAREDHVHPVDTSRAPLASPHFSGLPEVPTPDQFDATLLAVNSAFVQRALGSFSGVADVANGAFANAGHAGKNLNIGVGSSYLPTTIGLADGVTLHYKNTGVGSHTLSRMGADVISCDGSTLTSIVIGTGEELTLVKVGSNWIGSGAAALKYTAGFKFISGGNGYQRLPSGLIIQWGMSAPSTTSVNVTFPIAFPNACLWMGTQDSNGQPNLTLWSYTLAIPPVAFTAWNIGSITKGSTTINPSVNSGCPWFAIGF